MSKSGAYYNERDPYAAQWLRNLIAAGHIAAGEVDERSITDVSADELAGFAQCHFFAGIGVWSLALRNAGWPDDRQIWTGSCPCQPFSAAGKQKGFADERHLWPVWFNLISQRRPAIVVGEQVATALDWLDLVSADMEASGYAFAAADLCAAGFGGAHIRQRLYFAGVADTNGGQSGDRKIQSGREHRLFAQGGSALREGSEGPWSDADSRLADSEQPRLEGHAGHGHHSDQPGRIDAEPIGPATLGSWSGGMAQPKHERHDRSGAAGAAGSRWAHAAGLSSDDRTEPAHAPMLGRNPADWLYCRDGKWRPVEPSTFPLVDAAPARVGRLRAYGNALDAETASQFIGAVMECLP